MIIKREDFKRLCDDINIALDTSTPTLLATSVQLVGEGTYLCACVSNREYFVKCRVDTGNPVQFNATVDATLLIKLISKLTSDTITMTVSNNVVNLSADGDYQLPMIYDDNEMLEIPEIVLENTHTAFDVKSDFLRDILTYNVKEMTKESAVTKVQQMCYLDTDGAITFSTGACVNEFTLPSTVKVLLNPKIIALFRLFLDNPDLHIEIGEDTSIDSMTVTKIKFENDSVSATAVLCDDKSLVDSVPAIAIRGRATKTYDNTVQIRKDTIISCIDRLLIFSKFNKSKPYCEFAFNDDKVTITDTSNGSVENVFYETPVTGLSYSTCFNIEDLRSYIEKCVDKNITLNFGDCQAMVISYQNIKNVIPELHLKN